MSARSPPRLHPGIHAFGPLAINFMLEGMVRLGGVYVLIKLDWA